MSGKPAARATDPTACPLPGHGPNPIVTGSADVFFDGLPAAREGDMTACGGALVGNLSSTVFINDKPAAMQGSVGSHGNPVIAGSGTVIIGDTYTAATFIPPLPMRSNLPFSDYCTFVCQDTGKPMTGIAYTIKTASGKTLSGVTRANGQTRMISGSKAEEYELLVEEQTSVVIG